MTDLLARIRAHLEAPRPKLWEAVCQDELDAMRRESRACREREDALREDLHALLRQGEEAA